MNGYSYLVCQKFLNLTLHCLICFYLLSIHFEIEIGNVTKSTHAATKSNAQGLKVVI